MIHNLKYFYNILKNRIKKLIKNLKIFGLLNLDKIQIEETELLLLRI